MTDNITNSSAVPSAGGSPIGAASRPRDATHPRTAFTDALADQVSGVELSEAQSIFLVVLLYLRAFSDRRRTVEGTFAGLSQGGGASGGSRTAQPLVIGSSLPIPASDAASSSTQNTLHTASIDLLAGSEVGEDEHPPSYALSINETTWSFLTDMLELRVSLATYSATTDGVSVPSTIIDERALRALFMRAIIWYIDRECIPLSGVQVAFVGRRVGEEVDTQYPCLPINEIRRIAEELPLEGMSATVLADFDPYMFCAGEYFTSECSVWRLFFIVTLCIIASALPAYLVAHVFEVFRSAVIVITGGGFGRLFVTAMVKVVAALDVIEQYLLHIGVVIFGILQLAIHLVI